ncbi:MAG: TfuA-like protein [Gammaproteobacteria bacterium]|nr:TfuA-like protein [Gammaproteobacteria bacterium]
MINKKIIVFLGPSLSLLRAQEILPVAHYLPPIKCGDLLRVLRLKPDIVAIIDGCFEKTAAIWHKEILFALENGVKVYGASSMGALRAAELTVFGMHGVGEIFDLYRTNKIIDDDEVAVLHASSKSNYLSLSDAMVNIRATLLKVVKQELIDQVSADAIINSAKSLPYSRRNLKNILQKVLPDKIEIILQNYVDQKQEDAISLLNLLQQDLKQNSLKQKNVSAERSIFFRALHNDVMCRPFHANDSWLPVNERALAEVRLFGETYRFLRRLAYIWSSINAIATSKKEETKNCPLAEFFDFNFNTEWQTKNDINTDDFKVFFSRFSQISKFLSWQKQFNEYNTLNYSDFLVSWMQLTGDYQNYKMDFDRFQANEPLRYNILHLSAVLWKAIDIEAARRNLVPQLNQVQAFANQFFSQRHLVTKEVMLDWLRLNDLDEKSFNALMTRLVRFRFLVMQLNLDVIGVFQDCDNVCFLLEVARLTNVYEIAKKMLFDNKFKRTIAEKYLQDKPVKNDSDAFSLDFFGGYDEFVEFLG